MGLLLTLLLSTAFAQNFGAAFQRGYNDAQTDKLRKLQIEALERQRARDELAISEQRRADDEESRTRREELDKTQRIQQKLEALKLGYELTDDGQLIKIEKPSARSDRKTKTPQK